MEKTLSNDTSLYNKPYEKVIVRNNTSDEFEEKLRNGTIEGDEVEEFLEKGIQVSKRNSDS